MNKLNSVIYYFYIAAISFNCSLVGQTTDFFTSNKIIGGSAVVIFRDTNEIVVAADCKATHLNKQDAGFKICKIHYFPFIGIGFASAGSIINKEIGYDLNQIAKDICFNKSSIQVKGNEFVKKILPSFIQNLNSMEKFVSLVEFKVQEQNAQVCFFGFQNDSALVSHAKIIPDSTFFKTGKYNVTVKCTDSTNFNYSKIYFLGSHDKMYEALQSGIVKKPYSKAGEQLIRIAINNNKETVGTPISVLQLRKKNYNWFLDGCCN